MHVCHHPPPRVPAQVLGEAVVYLPGAVALPVLHLPIDNGIWTWLGFSLGNLFLLIP